MIGSRSIARSLIGHRRAAASLAAGLALLALGCGEDEDAGGGGGERAAASAVKVNIASFKFAPDPIEVQAGGTVTWVNQDTAPHTAEAEARPAFDTGRLDTGDRRRVRFDRPGRFTYFCDFHRFMTGTVEVVE